MTEEMREKKERGRLIVVEGPDGVGKSIQTMAIYNYLSKEHPHISLHVTKEPGGSLHSLCGEIRRILFKEHYSRDLHPDSSGLLFFLDHMQNAIVTEALVKAGAWVLSDRWCYSQYAYNEVRAKTSDIATNLYVEFEETSIQPDLLFLLTTSPNILRERIEEREEKKEKDLRQKEKQWGEQSDFPEKIIEAYDKVYNIYRNYIHRELDHPSWIKIIDDGLQTPEFIFFDHIQPYLDEALKIFLESTED